MFPFLFLIWFLYGAPSLVFFLLTFRILSSHKRFQHPFYSFFKYDIVLNSVFYLNFIWSKLISQEATSTMFRNFQNLYPSIRYLRHSIIFFSSNAQIDSLILKCILRYTMSKYPTASFFWSAHYRRAYLIAMLISGVLTIPHMLIITVHPLGDDPNGWIYISNVTLVYSIFWGVLILMFGVLIGRNITQYVADSQCAKSNRRVLICDLMVHFLYFLGYLIPTWIFPTNDFYMRNSIGQLTSDLTTLSGPWILLICDRVFRREMCNFVKQIRERNSVSIELASSVNVIQMRKG